MAPKPNINLDALNNIDSNMTVSSKQFTEDEILKSGGIIYDPSRAGEAGPSVLPNVDDILDSIYKLLEYMATEEMITLKATNVDDYEFTLEDKFPAFVDKYYSMFKMITSGEDITPMFKMLAAIDSVNKGYSTLEDVEKGLGEELADEFVKPIVDTARISSEADDDLSEFDDVPEVKKKKRRKKKKK